MIAWGTFLLIVQLLMPILAYSDTGVAKFGCDNDRISVAITPQTSAIEITRGAGKGSYQFASERVATPFHTDVTGTGSGESYRLYVRQDHWGHVRLTDSEGKLVADELVYCDNR